MMRYAGAWSLALLGLAFSMAGCSSFDDLSLDALRCQSRDDCPAGSQCSDAGYCQRQGWSDDVLDVVETVGGEQCGELRCGEDFTCCSLGYCVRLSDGCVQGATEDESCVRYASCGSCQALCGDNEQCVAGQCMCGDVRCGDGKSCCSAGVCADLSYERNHCGLCGRACEGAEFCSLGQCVCEFGLGGERVCGPGETCCQSPDSCRNLDSDPLSCGECGRVCRAGERCVAGVCVCPGLDGLLEVCGEGESCCGQGEGSACVAPDDLLCFCGGALCGVGESCCGEGTSVACVRLSDNGEHCGACGVACAEGYSCTSGTCVFRCEGGLSPCEVDGEPVCIDLLTDRTHCGGCGVACQAGEVCVFGTCSTSCPLGLSVCEERCVDLRRDRDHCGACANACSGGEVCVSINNQPGVCSLDCQEGSQKCGSPAYCADIQKDRENCGGCGIACPTRHVCVEGTCKCIEGLTSCGSAGCVDLSTSPSHCGECQRECAAGQLCLGGTCTVSCQPHQRNCSGICRDVTIDMNNCGACGSRCEPKPGAAAVCVNGSCDQSCLPGYANCDGPMNNGCEVHTAGDVENCGGCGAACESVPFATVSCVGGGCVYTCLPGRDSCDGQVLDTGCEVNLATDPLHCGGCDRVCPRPANATATCSNHVCSWSCNGSYYNCNGTCRLLTSTSSCGSCQTQCATGAICSSQICRCGTGGPLCTTIQGSSCSSGVCLCGTGPACTDATKCVGGACVPL